MSVETSPTSLRVEINNIPLVDDDPQIVVQDNIDSDTSPLADGLQRYHSIDSIPSSFTNGSNSPSAILADDISSDQLEEKTRLITQVLELQNTLDDLSHRVDSVKKETLTLCSENQVLSQYIENLMSASNVFSSTSPKPQRNDSVLPYHTLI